MLLKKKSLGFTFYPIHQLNERCLILFCSITFQTKCFYVEFIEWLVWINWCVICSIPSILIVERMPNCSSLFAASWKSYQFQTESNKMFEYFPVYSHFMNTSLIWQIEKTRKSWDHLNSSAHQMLADGFSTI